MEQARAAALLSSDDAERRTGSPPSRSCAPRGDLRRAARSAICRPAARGRRAAAAADHRDRSQCCNSGAWLQSVYYGLSLGSVLLLAAAGLAITFGVMGVINMAHGEMVMIGAYVTFVVQGAAGRSCRRFIPPAFWSPSRSPSWSPA